MMHTRHLVSAPLYALSLGFGADRGDHLVVVAAVLARVFLILVLRQSLAKHRNRVPPILLLGHLRELKINFLVGNGIGELTRGR